MQILFRHADNKELRIIGECPEDAEYIIKLCDDLSPWASTLWIDSEDKSYSKESGIALGVDMMKIINALCPKED